MHSRPREGGEVRERATSRGDGGDVILRHPVILCGRNIGGFGVRRGEECKDEVPAAAVVPAGARGMPIAAAPRGVFQKHHHV